MILRGHLLVFCMFFGDSRICWKAKKQPTMSCSSPKAEYRALACTAIELVWIAQLLADLRILVSKPVMIFCNNQVALHVASNPIFRECTKHIICFIWVLSIQTLHLEGK